MPQVTLGRFIVENFSATCFLGEESGNTPQRCINNKRKERITIMDTLVQRADRFADRAHRGQYRKVGGEAFISHPREVMRVLSETGAEESILAAALLHDVVEDTPITIDVIEAEFGSDVSALVWGCTEPGTSGNEPKAPWHLRKQGYLAHLKSAGYGTRMIALADKLVNARDQLKSLQGAADTNSVWVHFSTPPKDQKWWWQQVDGLFQGMDDLPPEMIAELHGIIAQISTFADQADLSE
jgi:hypothetical protein